MKWIILCDKVIVILNFQKFEDSSEDCQPVVEAVSDDEFVSDDDADEKVGAYERDEDWVAMEKDMNEDDYVLASDDEQMNEPSKSDIRFVKQNNCT